MLCFFGFWFGFFVCFGFCLFVCFLAAALTVKMRSKGLQKSVQQRFHIKVALPIAVKSAALVYVIWLGVAFFNYWSGEVIIESDDILNWKGPTVIIESNFHLYTGQSKKPRIGSGSKEVQENVEKKV